MLNITRLYLSTIISVTFLNQFWLYDLELNKEAVTENYEVYRILTSLFYFPLTVRNVHRFICLLVCLYHFGCQVEEDEFPKRPADYLYMIIFSWLTTGIISVMIGNIPTLVDTVIFVILYLWCHLSQNATITFFDYVAPAAYLPWIVAALSSLFGPKIYSPVIGNFAGMLYIFLKFNLPQEFGGPDLLKTPGFLKKLLPDIVTPEFGPAPRQNRNE